MALGTAATIGLSALGGAGILGAAGVGEEEGSVTQQSRLSPEQQKLMTPLSQFLMQQLQGGATPYGGELTAGMTPMQQQAMSQMGQYMGSQTPLSGEVEGAFSDYLAGTKPEEMIDFYNQYLLPSQERTFQESTLPGIKESWAGPTGEGGYWGSGRATAEGRAHEVHGEQVATGRGSAVMTGRAQGLQALGMAPALGKYISEGPLRRATAGWNMGEGARGIEGQKIQAEFQEFLRTQPGAGDTINQILQFLGLSTVENIIDQGQPSPFATLFSQAAPMAGAFLGGPAMGAASAGSGAVGNAAYSNFAANYPSWGGV